MTVLDTFIVALSAFLVVPAQAREGSEPADGKKLQLSQSRHIAEIHSVNKKKKNKVGKKAKRIRKNKKWRAKLLAHKAACIKQDKNLNKKSQRKALIKCIHSRRKRS